MAKVGLTTYYYKDAGSTRMHWVDISLQTGKVHTYGVYTSIKGIQIEAVPYEDAMWQEITLDMDRERN